MTTTQLPETIRAYVHEDAIQRVTRFFDATTVETLNELFQNCRRANATQITVTIDERTVTVSDDGEGISNPAALLSFGQADWEEDTVRSEDPAGMGFYSLSRFDGVSVQSHGRFGTWYVELHAEHFLGNEAAIVQRLTGDLTHGTTIKFEDPQATERDVASAARYMPIPVTCNSQTVPQSDFLERCVLVEQWQGLRIGVVRGRVHADNQINFHGITTGGAKLPHVTDIDGGAWGTVVDVTNCPSLELALPARRQVIQNDFLEELRRACQRSIYRAILAKTGPVDVSYHHYTVAQSMGVNLPPARNLLSPWEPEKATEAVYGGSPEGKQQVPDDGILMPEGIMETCHQQAFDGAAESAGVKGRLWQADPRLEGYQWYNQLTTATHTSCTATTDGEEAIIIDDDGDSHKIGGGRPDDIQFSLHTVQQGTTHTIAMPTDLAFGTEEIGYAENPNLLITKNSSITVPELTSLLMDAFFCPSDDAAADSNDTQEEQWEEEFTKVATKFLLSNEEAITAGLVLAASRHLRYHLPYGYAATIHVQRGNTPQVTLERTDEEPN